MLYKEIFCSCIFRRDNWKIIWRPSSSTRCGWASGGKCPQESPPCCDHPCPQWRKPSSDMASLFHITVHPVPDGTRWAERPSRFLWYWWQGWPRRERRGAYSARYTITICPCSFGTGVQKGSVHPKIKTHHGCATLWTWLVLHFNQQNPLSFFRLSNLQITRPF